MSDDLKAHAASNEDFYTLLDLSPAANDTEIRRAYRRTALKYHPDKIANPTPADIDKFHLLQIANDVLSDPSVRQLYDNAREARQRKQRERDLMDSAKRQMREDLEARERAGAAAAMGAGAGRGVKRTWMGAGDDDAEEKLQREIERIAENNRRMRREAQEKLEKEASEEQKKTREEEEEARRAADRSSQRVDRSQDGGMNVPEMERSVKVRWIREGPGVDLDKDRLAALFASFGKVEHTILLKDKRQRVGEKREKKTVATGMLVFASIVSAHSAVLDSKKKIGPHAATGEWAVIDSVFWASGTQPDLGTGTEHRSSPSPSKQDTTAAPPPSTTTSSFNFPGTKVPTNGSKAPSFASFNSVPANPPKASSFNPATKTPGAPSFQEQIMMRMKAAQREKEEREALLEKMAKEDAAADAAESAAAKAT
ncbi:uncharacterized protein PFLUO_LOCUS4965 [Penicillium psychrofluorescens]|uniref:uncharacterized protein n=1 Tax=Penicillium psychrofluorescens TaxID=3158075 RepID=UPI003CCDE1C4